MSTRRANVRQAMLEAARMLVTAEGYRGLSMRRLARQRRLHAQNALPYFADKDDLLSESSKRTWGASFDRL